MQGCGIVEFEAPEEAAVAIQTLNHTQLDGRQIFVREDREDSDLKQVQDNESLNSMRSSDRVHKRNRPVSAGSGGGPVTIGRRVWVGNLSYATTWQDLKDHFRQAGNVIHADIMQAKLQGRGQRGLGQLLWRPAASLGSLEGRVLLFLSCFMLVGVILQDAESNSKGCGIVTFASPHDALRAISLLSNSMLGDRQIMVREDREDPTLPRPQRAGGGGIAGPGGGPMGGGGPVAFGGMVQAGAAGQHTQLVFHGLPYSMAWQDLKDLARQAGNVVHADVMLNPDGTSKGWGVVQYASAQDALGAIQRLNGMQYEGRIVTVKYDKFAQ
ncbi:hypothetical protein N2152v2_008746 [Parachlorella kessleri]